MLAGNAYERLLKLIAKQRTTGIRQDMGGYSVDVADEPDCDGTALGMGRGHSITHFSGLYAVIFETGHVLMPLSFSGTVLSGLNMRLPLWLDNRSVLGHAQPVLCTPFGMAFFPSVLVGTTSTNPVKGKIGILLDPDLRPLGLLDAACKTCYELGPLANPVAQFVPTHAKRHLLAAMHKSGFSAVAPFLYADAVEAGNPTSYWGIPHWNDIRWYIERCSWDIFDSTNSHLWQGLLRGIGTKGSTYASFKTCMVRIRRLFLQNKKEVKFSAHTLIPFGTGTRYKVDPYYQDLVDAWRVERKLTK